MHQASYATMGRSMNSIASSKHGEGQLGASYVHFHDSFHVLQQSYKILPIHQINPADHAMNFLNTDFGSSPSRVAISTEKEGPSSNAADELRDFFMTSSYRAQAVPQEHGSGVQQTNIAGDATTDTLVEAQTVGKAGPVGTLVWHTLILAERSVKNYVRNLLAYGVRAGMYGGMGLMLA